MDMTSAISRLLVMGPPPGARSGAAGAAAGPQGGAAMLMAMAPFIVIFLIFYFLIIAPQRKQQKETEKMLASLKKGDRVVTSGGIHGTIADLKEAERIVVLQVAQNVRIDVSRVAITGVVRESIQGAGPK
jgi:preprotein translocase subunit YajC